ncbi:hypothetical protein [Aestuariibius sp. HNIBRBA575]|uniref:hypothetical protein n=1 Tax=Aestuariibius sp. HNIBRBA575 TaxID=3233343 RepID=UPI0034A5CB85
MTWPFALPVTLALFWTSGLAPLNGALGFAQLPSLEPHTVLFGNFFGSVVVIWAVVRLWSNDTRLGVFDGIGRVMFSIAMINALMSGITPLIWLFLVPEALFGVAQLLALVPRSDRVRA